MTSGRTVPTRIVNKNGVATTVHKRVDTLASAARKTIPAVSAPAPAVTGMTVEQLQSRSDNLSYLILNELDRGRYKMSDRVKAKTLATLRPDALDRLAERKITVINIYTRTIGRCLFSRDFALFNNLSVFLEDGRGNEPMDTFVAGLNVHRDTDYCEASESEIEAARSVIHVAMHVPQKYLYAFTTDRGTTRYLRSDLLRDLVEERPNDADRIIELLTTRKLEVETEDDVLNLSELLDSESHASIDSGVL